ncbi:MAG: LolA family protein [Chitinophagales bacterium]
MQKRLGILVVALLLVSSLIIAGCGKSKVETSTPSDKSATTKQSEVQKNVKGGSELSELMNSARNIKGMSYDMVITGSGANLTSKVWQSGKKIRTESEFGGMKSIMIINPDKNLFCSYMPDTNTAMAFDEETKKSMDTADYWSNEGKVDYKITGSEKCAGFDCKVIEGTPEGKDKVTIWVREDLGVPVKIESTTYEATAKIEFKNYKIGSQPDSLFELPAGVKITPMPTVPTATKTP